MVFSAYLHLLEEDLRELWPDFVWNSLLFGLLGAGGHQQLDGNPVVSTLQSAYFAEFAQRIAEYFASLFSTACTTQDAWDQTRGEIALDSMKTELVLDCTIVHLERPLLCLFVQQA